MTGALWQPTLSGTLLRLRPLVEDDFLGLFEAASDPLIWEQHPDPERYRRERFEPYFRTGIESKGALAILDRKTGEVIGSSRFSKHDLERSTIEIGYTFLKREFWGKGYNAELKSLMLQYAFQLVDSAMFFVGERNLRSRAAMLKLGAVEVDRDLRSQLDGSTSRSIIYRIAKPR